MFGFDSQASLGLFSTFGYVLFLFYIGVKTDMSMVHRTRKSATSIGTVAVIAPFLCGVAVLQFYSSYYVDTKQVRTLGFLTGMLSLTPFPVISSVLNDLKILNSELGRLGLASALVSEMFSIFLASAVALSGIRSREGDSKALISLAAIIFFILLVIFIIRPAMFWIIKQTPEGSLVNDHYVYCLFIIALLAAYATHRIDLYAILGPYVLGLAIPEGPPLGTAIIIKIDTFVNGVLMPILVTISAMRVDLKDLVNWRDKVTGEVDQFMVQTLVIIVVTFVIKFGACMLPPLCNRMPFNDALCLSLIMSCKGIVEMAAYSFVKDIVVSIPFLASLIQFISLIFIFLLFSFLYV